MTASTTMKALEFVKKTGEIKVVEVNKPALPRKPKVGQPNLLVKVVASAMDAGFAKTFPGTRDGFFIHSGASPLYLGWHFSGIVEQTTGSDCDITVGTAVFGFLEYAPTQKQGSFAEYIVVSSTACAIKPDDVSFETAAASATEASTALQALRDCGRLTTGKSVLICGATGGVGSAAMYIAKCLGASKITAMCSERDVQRIKDEYQPDAILNRSQYAADGKDPIQSYGEKFDVIFDCPSAFAAYKYFNCLQPKGTFVVTTPTLGLILGFFYSILTWSSKRVRMVMGTPLRKDFTLIGEWLSQGKLKIPIESTFNVADMQAAIQAKGKKSNQGRVVIRVQNGWDQQIVTEQKKEK